MGTDRYGRTIDYLRISLTDRCNLRCVYCMPEEGVEFRPHEEMLSFEEIERFAECAVRHGITKIRLTGGEPLVRKGVVDHIRRLREITGLEAIALTTNGTLLPKYAQELADAGLTRVNISLDTLDPEVYSSITRGGKLEDALAGLEAAFDVGFDPVKLNVVVVRSLEQDLAAFARMSIGWPLHVRFIEYMPVGGDADEGSGCAGDSAGGQHWTRADHVPSDEILAIISESAEKEGLGALEAVGAGAAPGGWGPAKYYRFPGGLGTVGVISPLSHHFCGECNRLRLTADGRVRTCLFSDDELDARTVLRTGSQADLDKLIEDALLAKPESHEDRIGTSRGMSQIGG